MSQKDTDIKIGGRFWSTTVDGKVIDSSQIDESIINLKEATIDGKSIATQEWVSNEVNGKITGKATYIGTIDSLDTLKSKIGVNAGDYCRITANDIEIGNEITHIGDVLIAKKKIESELSEDASLQEYWDVIHSEDISNYVNLTDNQEISGQKSFLNPVGINGAIYSNDSITPSISDYKLKFPTPITKDETIATQEWIDTEIISNLPSASPLEAGTGSSSAETKDGTLDESGVNIPGAIASGLQSIAFGGQRYDKVGESPDTEPITTASGIQSFAAGGGNQSLGRWSATFNKDNIVYQGNGFAANQGNVVGMAKAEFNQYYWSKFSDTDYLVPDSTGKALNGGRGLEDGKVKDKWGTTYETMHHGGAAFGEGNTVIGRAGFAVGRANEVYGEYAFSAGEGNKIKGGLSAGFGRYNEEFTDSFSNIFAGSFNTIAKGENNAVFGYRNAIVTPVEDTANASNTYAKNNLISGERLKASYDKQVVFGSGNLNNPKNILEIGGGNTGVYTKTATFPNNSDFTGPIETLNIVPHSPNINGTVYIEYIILDGTKYSETALLNLIEDGQGSQKKYIKYLNGVKTVVIENVSKNSLGVHIPIASNPLSITYEIRASVEQSLDPSEHKYIDFGIYFNNSTATSNWSINLININNVDDRKNIFEIARDGVVNTSKGTLATQDWVQDNVNLSYAQALSTDDIRLLSGDNGVFKATLTLSERSFLPTSKNFTYTGFNFSSGDTLFPVGYSLNKVDIELKSNATGSTNIELDSGIYHKNYKVIEPYKKGAIYFRFTFKSDIASSDEFQITANTYELELSDNLIINSFSDLGGLVNIASTHYMYTPSSITYDSGPFELVFNNSNEGSFDLSYFVEGNSGVTLTNNSFNRRAFWLNNNIL